jgi:hypothetical protein
MGTVASVDATHIDVKTKDGKTVKVTLNDKTKCKKGDANAATADVKPGMKVSVHLADDGSAGEVHLSPARRIREPAASGMPVLCACFESANCNMMYLNHDPLATGDLPLKP